MSFRILPLASAIMIVAMAARADEPSAPGVVSLSAPAVGASDLSDSLSAARLAFLQLDVGAAAARIREGSHVLRLEAGNAAGDVKQTLVNSASNLETLARRVEQKNVARVEELDHSFAHALHATAQHHYLLADQHWRAGELKLAGHRLEAAAHHLESAVAASGNRLSAATETAIRESRQVSLKLIHGTGHATGEVGRAFESLQKQVDTLGEKVAPVALRNPASALN